MYKYLICIYIIDKIYKSKKQLFVTKKGKFSILATNLNSNKRANTKYYTDDSLHGTAHSSKKDKHHKVEFLKPDKYKGITYTIIHESHSKKSNKSEIKLIPYTVVAETKKGVKQTAKGHLKVFKLNCEKQLKMSDLKLLKNSFDGLYN